MDFYYVALHDLVILPQQEVCNTSILYFDLRSSLLLQIASQYYELNTINMKSPSSSLTDISNGEINEWVKKTNALQRTIKKIAEGTLDPVSDNDES